MRGRYSILTASIAIFLLVMIGCEKVQVHEPGPFIKKHYVITNCGGELTTTPNLIEGSNAMVAIEFTTENVAQDFQIMAQISTNNIGTEKASYLSELKDLQVKSTDVGKASGRMWAVFDAVPQCGGASTYILDAVIIDSHGRQTTYQTEIVQNVSVMSGNDPCKCLTQCGFCTLKYGIFERCMCGCPLYYEQCR